MAKAVRFYETGGPEVLRYEDVEVGEPGPGQVRLRHVAVGLNYADTYFRNGTYPIPLANGMGVEASGVVQAVGEGVSHVAVGDRVTYTGFMNTLGAYSTGAPDPCRAADQAAGNHRVRNGRGHDHARPHGLVSDASPVRLQTRGQHPAARRCGWCRVDRLAMGQAAGADRDRYRVHRRQGRIGACPWLRPHHQLQPRRRGQTRARADRRGWRQRGVRQRRAHYLHGLAGLAQAPWPDGLRGHRFWHHRAVRPADPGDQARCS